MIKNDLTYQRARIELAETARAAQLNYLISTSSDKCRSLLNRIPMFAAVITVLVTHHLHDLKRSNLSENKNRVSRDSQSSPVSLAYFYIKLQVWVLIESNTYDCCCNHSAGKPSTACFKKI